MTKNRIFISTAICSAAICTGVLFAQTPVVNIGTRHGNLRSAQQSIVSAYHSIESAQGANDGQLGGHAQNAKNLLIQADQELRLAANVSNQEGR